MACTETDQTPNITMHGKKGDTWIKTVKVLINGVVEELNVANGDIIYFSVKEAKDSTSYALQDIVTTFTAEGYASILFTEEQMLTLTEKKYVYDCQWTRTSTNFVKTLFEGAFVINTTNITEEGA